MADHPRRRLALGLLGLLVALVGLPWLVAPIGAAFVEGPSARPTLAPKLPAVSAGDSTTPGRRAPKGRPTTGGATDDWDGEPPLGDTDLFGSKPEPSGPGRGLRGRLAPLSNDDLFVEGSIAAPTAGATPASSPTPGLDSRVMSSPERASSDATPTPIEGSDPRSIGGAALLRAALGSLLVGLLTATVATVLGGLLGLLSGYRGGWIERIAVRWFADGLDALPQFVVLVTAVALYRDLFGTEGDALMVAIGLLIGLVNATQVLLVVHHQTRLIAARKYVIAARLMGWRGLRVVRRKVLPYLRHELIIPFTQLIIWGVFVETALSYLGFGPSSTGSTLGAQLHRIDPIARPEDVGPAIVMCLITICLAASLRTIGDVIDTWSGAHRKEGLT